MICRYTAFLAALLAGAFAAQAAEDSKEQDCRYQSQVVAAVQKARLDGVREGDLADAIARTGPDWPERYNKAIPILAGAIYQLEMRQLRNLDLAAQWMEMCMQQQ